MLSNFSSSFACNPLTKSSIGPASGIVIFWDGSPGCDTGRIICGCLQIQDVLFADKMLDNERKRGLLEVKWPYLN